MAPRRALATFLLASLLVPAVAGDRDNDTLVIPIIATWDHVDLDIVIVPTTAFPVTNTHNSADLVAHLTQAEPVPSGVGVGPDSPYIQAVLDATRDWDATIDAYAADRTEATYVAAFTVTARVFGVDADLDDLQTADIRVLFPPTMHLGGAAPQSRDEEGRMQWCEIVVSQWFVSTYSVADMYNVYKHELGHCFGLDHPAAPAVDLMEASYNYFIGGLDTPRVCASTLDLAGLAVAYEWLAGGTWTSPPSEVVIPAADYGLLPAPGRSTACPNEAPTA